MLLFNIRGSNIHIKLTSDTFHSLDISAMGPETEEQASPNTITIVLLLSTMSKKNFVATAMSHWNKMNIERAQKNNKQYLLFDFVLFNYLNCNYERGKLFPQLLCNLLLWLALCTVKDHFVWSVTLFWLKPQGEIASTL